MEYLVGILLSLGAIVLAAGIGFARERSFYSTVLIVIATYYVLFAAMGAERRTLVIEIVIASGFILFAVLGFKGSLWLVAAALVGHGIFDFIRPSLIAKSRSAALVAGFLHGIRCDFWRMAGVTTLA